jgi:hypothetical protein
VRDSDVARDQLLDDDENVLRGKGDHVTQAERRLRPLNAWRLIPFFELFMSCPKDELHQWYLGLFGDHIVPDILYRYTQVLRQPDLISSNGKPFVTKARLERVWTRLADRLATVVADTSMITISPEYAGHFYDLYINGNEKAKLTGDHMKMLMLTLPFILRDLIADEVYLSHT